jgi:hypothetical protein
VRVDGELRGYDVATGAGLDLDETEGIALPGDEIHVARQARGLPAPGDDCVTPSAEMEERLLLAA